MARTEETLASGEARASGDFDKSSPLSWFRVR